MSVGLRKISRALTAAITAPTAASLQDILHKDGSYTFDNTTDSLEAIADALSAIPTSNRCTFTVDSSTATGDTNYHTLLNVSGSGILYDVMCKITNAASGLVKITIDDQVLTSIGFTNANYQGVKFIGASQLDVTGTDYLPYSINAEFATGLKIEIKTQDAGETVSCEYHYGVDA